MKTKRTGWRLAAAFALGFLTLGGAAANVMAADGDVAINDTNFPDTNFRSYVETLEGGSDGVFTAKELQEITVMDVSERKISNLTGIEHFTGLLLLYCSENSLTTLDVSQNTSLIKLSCSFNSLTNLDVSKNTELTSLQCSDNSLTELDVSSNTALKSLNCSYNSLTELDVSSNTALESLNCSYNSLTELDVSSNTALESLDCGDNSLTVLDVSKNEELKSLSCGILLGDDDDAKLTELDVSHNKKLWMLYCSGNSLTKLDVSNNAALEYLYCGSNQLLSLDVSSNKALNTLSCYFNQLTSLDVKGNTALEYLECNNNLLSGLDVSNNIALIQLNCASNPLTHLDVSKNTALEYLNCSDDQLSSLDVSKNTALETLHCYWNSLTELDLSNNAELTTCDYDDGVTVILYGHTHTGTLHSGKAATCGAAGEKSYYTCTCGKAFEDSACTKEITNLDTWKVIAATGNHTYSGWKSDTAGHYQVCTVCGASTTKASHTAGAAVTTPATLEKNGSVKTACTVCGATTEEKTISYPKTFKLAKNSYTWDGKEKKPSVTVTDAAGNTVASSNYTLKYSSGRKNVGKYTVKITFKGNYTGTKTLTYQINPKGTSISKVTAGKKKLTVKWKKQTKQTTGYQIQYSLKKNFKSSTTVKVTKAKTTSKIIKSLEAKKKYYVRIRTYKTVKGTPYYSSWSKTKTVTTKK